MAALSARRQRRASVLRRAVACRAAVGAALDRMVLARCSGGWYPTTPELRPRRPCG